MAVNDAQRIGSYGYPLEPEFGTMATGVVATPTVSSEGTPAIRAFGNSAERHGNAEYRSEAIRAIMGLAMPVFGVSQCGLYRETLRTPGTIDRELQLRLKGHLWEMAGVNAEVLDSRQGFPAAIRGYEKTFESVADVGVKS